MNKVKQLINKFKINIKELKQLTLFLILLVANDVLVYNNLTQKVFISDDPTVEIIYDTIPYHSLIIDTITIYDTTTVILEPVVDNNKGKITQTITKETVINGDEVIPLSFKPEGDTVFITKTIIDDNLIINLGN